MPQSYFYVGVLANIPQLVGEDTNQGEKLIVAPTASGIVTTELIVAPTASGIVPTELKVVPTASGIDPAELIVAHPTLWEELLT